MAASPEELKSKPAGKTNYWPWILIGCGAALLLCLIVGALGAVLVYFQYEAPAR